MVTISFSNSQKLLKPYACIRHNLSVSSFASSLDRDQVSHCPCCSLHLCIFALGVVLSHVRIRESVAQPGICLPDDSIVLDAGQLSGIRTERWMIYPVPKTDIPLKIRRWCGRREQKRGMNYFRAGGFLRKFERVALNRLFKLSLFCTVLVLGMGSMAHAQHGFLTKHNPTPPPPPPPPPSLQKHVAPEIDPGMAVGGFTLLAGMLTVMRARRRS